MSLEVSQSDIDRLVYHMSTVAEHTTGEWARNFARSIIRQSRRRNWKPSSKQVEIMRKLVADVFAQNPDEPGDISVLEGRLHE